MYNNRCDKKQFQLTYCYNIQLLKIAEISAIVTYDTGTNLQTGYHHLELHLSVTFHRNDNLFPWTQCQMT